MSKFVLNDEVDELTYDFAPYAGSGSIPEPSSTQLADFRRALLELLAESQTASEGDSVPLVQQMQTYLAQDMTQMEEKLLHAVAALCSDSPSFDELNALPYRPAQAFLGWVAGTFIRPEASRLATTE
jgi:hypothetical protein